MQGCSLSPAATESKALSQPRGNSSVIVRSARNTVCTALSDGMCR